MREVARSRAVFGLTLLLLGLGAAAGAQPAYRVKDLNTTRPGGIESPLGPNYFLEGFVAAR